MKRPKDDPAEGIAEEMEPTLSSERRLALAKVGLNALIDEATGFQKERFKDPMALRKMLRKELGKK